MLTQNVLHIYVDGACSGNPGPGGWGVILSFNGIEKELGGSSDGTTTNSRMELTCAIEALKAVKTAKYPIVIYSDSEYLVKAFTEKRIENWIKNGWRTSSKTPVVNQDLWEMLIELTKKYNVTFTKVPGHSNDALNNRCDTLAKGQVIK